MASVAHVRQHLLHQPCCGLDANADHTQQAALVAFHPGLLETIQACLLDLADLITDQPTTIHVTTQLSHRVGRYWLALGRAQIFKSPAGLLQLGIEAADAEPDQGCFHFG